MDLLNSISEVIKTLTNKIDRLGKAIDMLSIPLTSQYRALVFFGNANGSALDYKFDINELKNKFLIIKSFKIYNYANSDTIDFQLYDGTTTSTETVPAGMRLDRNLDIWSNGTTVKLFVNQTPIGLFNKTDAVTCYPADLDLDNIFYKIPVPLQSLELRVTTFIKEDFNVEVNPDIKVIMEVYIVNE